MTTPRSCKIQVWIGSRRTFESMIQLWATFFLCLKRLCASRLFSCLRSSAVYALFVLSGIQGVSVFRVTVPHAVAAVQLLKVTVSEGKSSKPSFKSGRKSQSHRWLISTCASGNLSTTAAESAIAASSVSHRRGSDTLVSPSTS